MDPKRIIELVQGDITQEEVDAIVNAANSALEGGGGVDGAIHRAGGPAIMDELRQRYKGCPTGSAVITTAGKLKARYVIHAVGPRWRGGKKGEAELLASAYRKSLELAKEHLCKTISFPAISTGIYGYPLEEAAKISLQTVTDFLKKHAVFQKIRFVLFDEKALKIFQKELMDE